MTSEVRERSRLAGKSVVVKKGDFVGCIFDVEDYACNVFGRADWIFMFGNPTVLEFVATHKHRDDDERCALYGHIGMFAHVLQSDEIGEVCDD